jgi:hypothetical protein
MTPAESPPDNIRGPAMRRSHVALFLVLGSPVALYAAVLIPRNIPDRTDTPTSPAAYFPTTVGTKWVYQLTERRFGRVRGWEEVERVTEVTDNGNEKIVTVRQFEGRSPHPLTEWAVSEKGLRRRSVLAPEYRRENYPELPERWYLLVPARIAPGESWTSETDGGRSKTVLTVADWETVRVPAGAYKALRVDIEVVEFDRAGKRAGAFAGAFWYAPGVGQVKLELVADFTR